LHLYLSTENVTLSSSVFKHYLLLDIPDAPSLSSAKYQDDVCLLSYHTFVRRAATGATFEVPDLLKRESSS